MESEMERKLPELPLELLLDILEMLLALGGKANQRSAAYLAQSCRLLRSSEVGKRARYIHALASHSMSVPERLPKNLEYEAEVLETSSWPHEPPPTQPNDQHEDSTSLPAVSESFLDVDGHIALSLDRRSLICFKR